MNPSDDALRIGVDPKNPRKTNMWFGEHRMVLKQHGQSIVMTAPGSDTHFTMLAETHRARLSAHETIRRRGEPDVHGRPFFAAHIQRALPILGDPAVQRELRDRIYRALQPVRSPRELEAYGVRYLVPFPKEEYWTFERKWRVGLPTASARGSDVRRVAHPGRRRLHFAWDARWHRGHRLHGGSAQATRDVVRPLGYAARDRRLAAPRLREPARTIAAGPVPVVGRLGQHPVCDDTVIAIAGC
jgi:hypothetical protein